AEGALPGAPRGRKGPAEYAVTYRPGSRRLLVHVDLVAVQVLERHAGTVGLNLWLAVELDAGVLHPAILAHAVIGHDPEERLRSSLLADQRPVFIRFGQIESKRDHLIVGQPERHPALVSKWHVLGQDESQLLCVELNGILLILDVHAQQR